MDETAALARYVSEATYEDLPPEVVSHVKACIGDAASCALGARRSSEGDALIAVMKELGGKGRQESSATERSCPSCRPLK